MANIRHKKNTRVRRARIQESGQIAAVLRQAFSEFEALYTPRAYALTTPSSDQILKRWEEGPVWVAVLDSRIAGTVSAVPSGESLYMRSMAVIPAARGLGIGRNLLEEVERFAGMQGFRRMHLSTTPFLGAAIRLYESSGFRRSYEGPHDLAGTPLITMWKTIELPLRQTAEPEKQPGLKDDKHRVP